MYALIIILVIIYLKFIFQNKKNLVTEQLQFDSLKIVLFSFNRRCIKLQTLGNPSLLCGQIESTFTLWLESLVINNGNYLLQCDSFYQGIIIHPDITELNKNLYWTKFCYDKN